MKNKSGFTLIELLAVILILGIIALIAMPTVNSIVAQSKKSAFKATANGIINAIETKCNIESLKGNGITEYYEFSKEGPYPSLDIKGKLPTNGSGYVTDQCEVKLVVSDSDFGITKDYSDDKIVIDTKEVFEEKNNKITFSNDIIDQFECIEEEQTSPYVLFYNPETGKKCTSKEINTGTGVKEGCMRWFVYSENNDGTVNALLDHNTTGDVVYNSSGTNVNGPKEALAALKEDTKNWLGVPTRTDNYTVSNGLANFTIPYNGMHARFLTAQEVGKIIGKTNLTENTANSSSSSFLNKCVGELYEIVSAKYKANTITLEQYQNTFNDYYNKFKVREHWLFDYTVYSTKNGGAVNGENAIGYWLITPISNSKSFAWDIAGDGSISYCNITYPYYNGIRPVITISKSLIS